MPSAMAMKPEDASADMLRRPIAGRAKTRHARPSVGRMRMHVTAGDAWGCLTGDG